MTPVERDKVHLLQALCFLANVKESVLEPFQAWNFLCVEINPKRMILTAPQGKKDKIVSQCQTLLGKTLISKGELSQLIGWLKSTVIADLRPLLQFCLKQYKEIIKVSLKKDLASLIELTEEMKSELNCWLQNNYLSNGKALIATPHQLTTVVLSGSSWTFLEQNQINFMKMEAG